jgi:nitrilase
MAEKKLKIAAIQMATGPNVTANLAETERLVVDAAESGEIGRASCRERVS